MATATTTTEVCYEDQLADIEATVKDPELRDRKLAALYDLVKADLLGQIMAARSRALLQLAEQLGPRDMGPAHDSRYNWAAAARKRGISPVHVKDLASRARPTAKAT